jgi:hypothetical protein
LAAKSCFVFACAQSFIHPTVSLLFCSAKASCQC